MSFACPVYFVTLLFLFPLGSSSPIICGLGGAVSHNALLFPAPHGWACAPDGANYSTIVSRHWLVQGWAWTKTLNFSVGSRREGCLPLETAECKRASAGYIFPVGREILSGAGKEERGKQNWEDREGKTRVSFETWSSHTCSSHLCTSYLHEPVHSFFASVSLCRVFVTCTWILTNTISLSCKNEYNSLQDPCDILYYSCCYCNY